LILELKAQRLAEHGNFCDFGIEDLLIPLVTSGLGEVGLGGIADVAAPAIVGAGLGAGGGAGLGALTGEGAGKGAAGGAITGAAIGALGPVLGSAAEAASLPAGIATTAGDIGAGLIGGAAGGAVTGSPILPSTLGGGAAGLVAGVGAPAPAAGANSVPSAGGAGGSLSPTAATLPGGPPPDYVGPDLGAPAGTMGVRGSAGALLDTTGNTAYVGTMGLTPSAAGGGGYVPGAPNSAEVQADVAAAAPGGISPATQDIISSFPAASASGGSPIESIISKIAANPGILASGGLLGIEAMRQNKPLPEQAQLNQLGAQTAATGSQLSSYLGTGTLPPGANESIKLATSAAKSQVKSTAAQLGLSGSTWEADRLAQIDQQASAQGEQIATQLLQQGANYTQLSTAIFQNLLKDTLAQDQAFSNALSNFAVGLGGGRLAQSPATTA
jgi:hypothetical protein